MSDLPPWDEASVQAAEAEFRSYAQNRVVSGQRQLNSRAELRALMREQRAWNWTLSQFQERAGVRFQGDTAFVTTFVWTDPNETLADVWASLQAEEALHQAKPTSYQIGMIPEHVRESSERTGTAPRERVTTRPDFRTRRAAEQRWTTLSAVFWMFGNQMNPVSDIDAS